MRTAILAGGRATRFGGKLKGLELVGGERVLDRVVQALHGATGALPLLIANDPAARQWHKSLEVVPDILPESGTLGGIYTALSAGEGPVLVAAWDMPFVTAELVGALAQGASGYDAFLPESTGPLGVEPLCAVYGPACRDPIRVQLESEDFRTTTFHEVVNVGRLALAQVRALGDPETLFFNVNAPEDLERAQRLADETRARRPGAATPPDGGRS